MSCPLAYPLMTACLNAPFVSRVAGNNNPCGAVRSRSSEGVSCVLAFGVKSALQGRHPGSAPTDLIFSPYQYQRLIPANRGVPGRSFLAPRRDARRGPVALGFL